MAGRIRLLVVAAIAYNVDEAVAALSAESAASSGALIGFGLDSVIKVSSATAVAWQFSATDHGLREAREQWAQRDIAVLFFALAAHVAGETPSAPFCRCWWRAGSDLARPEPARSPSCAFNRGHLPGAPARLPGCAGGRRTSRGSGLARCRCSLLLNTLGG